MQGRPERCPGTTVIRERSALSIAAITSIIAHFEHTASSKARETTFLLSLEKRQELLATSTKDVLYRWMPPK